MMEHIPKKNPHTIQPTLLTLSTSNRSSTQQAVSPYNPIIINPTNQFNYLKNQIEIIGKRHIDLTKYVNQLYRSVQHCDRKIYGVRVYRDAGGGEGKEMRMGMADQTKKDSSEGKEQQGKLEKVQLDYKTKLYICSCEMLLNQNPISPTTLSNYLESLPSSQNELDQIRLEPPFLKFQKHNLCLSLCLVPTLSTFSSTASLQFPIPQIENNKYLLDSYDREGKNYMAMLQCHISFGWVQVQGSRYYIGGFIRNVTATQGFVGVVTDNKIAVICLTKKKIMKFQVDDCVDAKWGYRGFYYLQRNGQVGLLQRQTAFIPSFNTFTQILLPLPPSLLQTSTFTPEYHPQRLCPVQNLSSNNSLFFLSVHIHNPKKFLLQQIYSNKYGMKEDIYTVVEMKEIQGTILYKNIYAVGSEIRISAVVGRQQGQKGARSMEYWEYRVSTI